MIDTSDFKTGLTIELDGDPCKIVDFQHVKPGKGAAFVRTKIKNLKTGASIERTFRPGEKFQDAIMERRQMQYLYFDGENYVFMDTTSFETINVPTSLNEDLKYYLKEGEEYPILIFNDEAIDVKIPQKMVFIVAESENYVKGDTVSGATKPIITETGLTVRVPLFIKQDEKIMVNTESNEYVERVNS